MYLNQDDAVSLLEEGLGEAMRSRDVIITLYDHNTDQQAYRACHKYLRRHHANREQLPG